METVQKCWRPARRHDAGARYRAHEAQIGVHSHTPVGRHAREQFVETLGLRLGEAVVVDEQSATLGEHLTQRPVGDGNAPLRPLPQLGEQRLHIICPVQAYKASRRALLQHEAQGACST